MDGGGIKWGTKERGGVHGVVENPQPAPPPPQPPPPKSEKQRLLEMCDEANWQKLQREDFDYSERKKFCRELCDYISKSLGLKIPPKIEYVVSDDERYMGSYHRPTNTITFNIMNFYYHPRDTITTIGHETRHAYQHQRAEMGITELDRKWRENFKLGNYIKPPVDDDKKAYQKYKNQPVEADAFEYEEKFYNDFFKSK